MRLRVEARDCVLWRKVFYQLGNSVVKDWAEKGTSGKWIQIQGQCE